MPKIDYKKQAFCTTCEIIFQKPLITCKICSRKLRYHPKNLSRKTGIKRY